MTSGPPTPGDPKNEPFPPLEGPDPPAEDRSSLGTTLGRIAIGTGLLVGIAVAAFLFLRADRPERSAAHEPERGVACPDLRVALEQLQTGNDAAFIEAIRAAAQKAEVALQRSGQVFGHPEQLALELRSLVTKRSQSSRERIQAVLGAAEKSCTEVARS